MRTMKVSDTGHARFFAVVLLGLVMTGNVLVSGCRRGDRQPPPDPEQAAGEEAQTQAADEDPLRQQVEAAIDRALAWMKTEQSDNGSYGDHPGVTAMALLAFGRSHRRYNDDSGPFISDASRYLAGLAKPDGSIYDTNLPNYNTSLSIMALDAVDPAERHRELVRRGQQFLAWLQHDETKGVSPDDPEYGGIGYASDGRPDLANLHFALEALATTGYDGDEDVFRKALTFIERCQNRSESNDQPWAGDDGGFIYRPGESRVGETTSYGSMTYAGLKSLMYAQVDRDDPRIKDTWNWIRNNWSVEGNPGLGDMGLYYYYQTFAQALAVWGEQTVVDARGTERRWFEEMGEQILSLQHEDGYWVNENPRYWEANKLMATSRAVLALSYGLDRTPVLPRTGAN